MKIKKKIKKVGGNFGNKIFKLKIIYSKILNYFQSDFLKKTVFLEGKQDKRILYVQICTYNSALDKWSMTIFYLFIGVFIVLTVCVYCPYMLK